METWTEEEDAALMHAVGRGKRPAWKAIARDILGKKRSRHAARNRFRYLLARTQQRKKGKGKKEGALGGVPPIDVGDSDEDGGVDAARVLLELSHSPLHRSVHHSTPLTPTKGALATLAMGSESDGEARDDDSPNAHRDDDDDEGVANTEAWTAAEDEALLDSVSQRGRHAWTWISQEVKLLRGRSKNSVRNRYRRLAERGAPDERLVKVEARLRATAEEEEEDDGEDDEEEEGEESEESTGSVAVPAFDLNAVQGERLRHRR